MAALLLHYPFADHTFVEKIPPPNIKLLYFIKLLIYCLSDLKNVPKYGCLGVQIIKIDQTLFEIYNLRLTLFYIDILLLY